MLTVATLYHFVPLVMPQALVAPLRLLCAAEGLRGTLILATEGMNGTLCGAADGIARLRAHLAALPGCADLTWQQAQTATVPFRRLKIKVRPEIVTLGVPADPRSRVGRHVDPQDWNALIAAPDVVVIDTRNDYEIAVGGFAGAINPGTAAFSDFPAWWQAHRNGLRSKRIAMFCTGGIRCEKATSHVLARGAAQAFQLHGGILAYLAQVTPANSLWHGECFVFDDRVTVGLGQIPGRFQLCPACGWAMPQAAAQCGHCLTRS